MKATLRSVAALLFLPVPVLSVAQAAVDPSLLLTLTRSNQFTVLNWFGSNAMAYQVEVSSNLITWSDSGAVRPGNNATLAATNSAAGKSFEFFRVRRMSIAISAAFDPQTGILTVTGDALPNIIVVSRDGAGNIRVNGGAVAITGGVPTIANTTLIQMFGLAGNDQLALDEGNGPLPRANMYGDADNDTLTGGSGADVLNGGEGMDVLLGKGGADILLGGNGDDSLIGGDGDDQVFGEAGNDRLIWNPGDDTDLDEGGGDTDTVEVNGGNGAEVFTATANGTRVRFDRLDPAPFWLDIGTCEQLVLNANGGNDSFSCTGNLAALIQITADGGAGDDTLLGSNGNDTLRGGDNNDFVDGQQGNDVVFLGAGDDVFQWDPGDGSDTVEGEDGADRLDFNGSNVGEIYELVPIGPRLRFTRNVGSVIMDLAGMETVNANALGGADIVTVNDLSATDVSAVNLRLASTLGGNTGDLQVDSVIVNGTSQSNHLVAAQSGADLSILGLIPVITISGGETNDAIAIYALGGNDTVDISGITSLFAPTVDGGAGNDTLIGSARSDFLVGGDDNDTITGRSGNDYIYAGNGDDTLVWNPGDGSDLMEGEAGVDQLLFNGSNSAENLSASANGARVIFSRDVGNVTLDCNGVDNFRINALGGTDTITLGEFTGTSTTNIVVDLAASGGGGDAQLDTLIVNGTQTNDTILITGMANTLAVNGLFAAIAVTNTEAANDQFTLNALGGIDVVDASGLAAGVVKFSVNGGLGNDTLIGSQGDDVFTGGDGNDLALGGPGNDTFNWNPGDDNDTLEGQAGNDTLQFNGANVTENITLSANGGRLRFFRDVASVTLDGDDIETVRFEALGGADNITVNSLVGTDLTSVNLNLAAAGGGGDAQVDNVFIHGTGTNDTVTVGQSGGVVVVTGLSAAVNISGSEAVNDRVTFNLLAGDDVLDASALPAGIIALTVDGGDNNDFLIGSGGADTLLGGAGNDTLIGGPGVDVLDGGAGANTIIQD